MPSSCVTHADGGVALDSGAGVRIELDRAAVHDLGIAPSGVVVGIRPHDVERVGPKDAAAFRGMVDLVEPRGSDVVVRARSVGDDDRMSTALVAVLPADMRVEEGSPVAVRFPADRLHFFDPTSGARLG